MITRIELENFMSHRKTVIEPAPGLTVLIGPNNCGKSAVVAALQILSHNENSTYVKRHGAKECAVIVTTSEGHVIEWRRKTAPRYIINGVEHSRLGNSGVPDELHQVLRLPLVADEDDDSFNVHFGSQKSPIFLLASKAGTAAKFFASSSDASRLLQMQQTHKGRVAEARREHQLLEGQAATVNAQLAVLSAAVPVSDQLTELEDAHESLLASARRREELRFAIRELQDRLAARKQQQRRCQTLQALRQPPELHEVVPLESMITALMKAAEVTGKLSAEREALRKLKSIPQLDDVESLEHHVHSLRNGHHRVDTLDHQQHVLGRLPPPPVIGDVIALQALSGQLDRAARDVRETDRQRMALQALAAPPVPQPAEALEQLLVQLERTQRNVLRYRSATEISELPPPPLEIDCSAIQQVILRLSEADEQVKAAATALAAAAASAAEAASELRTAAEGQHCPTCGQPLDAEQLLKMSAPGHGEHLHD